MFWNGIGASFIFALIGHVLFSHQDFFRSTISKFLLCLVAFASFAVSFFALVAVGWSLASEVFLSVGWL